MRPPPQAIAGADLKASAMARGLSAQQALLRLRQDGYNELPPTRNRTILRIAAGVMREPMFLLLMGAGGVYLVLGDSGDALLLLGFVGMTMAITIFQERKTERVLETLRDLSSPRALVVRDGQFVRIPGREVVKGDVLVLEEGARVAADGILLESHDLLIDESLLTGESLAVSKQAGAGPNAAPAGQVYSGTMVAQGGGLAQVSAIGGATEIGKIGGALQALPDSASPLQAEIAMLVRRFAAIGIALSLLMAILYGWIRHDALNGFLAGVTLAMSILPEEFMVILTVFMALGAWRISKNQVLTRHTPVIEALGSATVLCTDKTGTLTENRMSVRALVRGPERIELDAGTTAAGLPAFAQELLDFAALASEIVPFDPMEQAIQRRARQCLAGADDSRRAWTIVHDYPLTADIMAMTHVWQLADQPGHVVASKGAPEAIIQLCKLRPEQAAPILAQVAALAAQGMRVLAVARAAHAGPVWPDTPHGFAFSWLGLLGLADPIRASVSQAVAECHRAGIRVIMITGDYPLTAQAIAAQAGIAHTGAVSGDDVEALDDQALQELVRHANVFARIRPQQKLRLVHALRRNGEVVAMTGDGVNDAPALKAAHIGIAMGSRGTDVAREAASLVLLNDDFAAIVVTVRLGRRIYDNLRKALTYVVAVHLPIAGMSLLPLLLGSPLVFFPVHIVFLEMIINPACAIVFEAEAAEADSMQRPPRAIGQPLFGRRNVWLAVLQGSGLLALLALAFFGSIYYDVAEAQARALAFAVLVVGNLILIVGNRSEQRSFLALLASPNQAQWWIGGGGLGALFLVLQVPFLQRIFHFAAIAPRGWLWLLLAAALAIAWFELLKHLFRAPPETAA